MTMDCMVSYAYLSKDGSTWKVKRVMTFSERIGLHTLYININGVFRKKNPAHTTVLIFMTYSQSVKTKMHEIYGHYSLSAKKFNTVLHFLIYVML